MRPNILKRRLAADQASSGCWLFTGSVSSAEILAHCGFHALLIDHEHSSGSVETMINQLRAIETTATTPLVRLAELTDSAVKLALDNGAQGLLVANVESADEVTQLLQASNYPPTGRRGAHFTVSRAARWGLDAESYHQRSRDELLIVAMIESAAGVEAIPDMARVGGIDMFFIGPLDLSASIGATGHYDDPAFIELLSEAERRIAETGSWLGGATMPGHGSIDLFKRGYRFASLASDVAILRDTGISLTSDTLALGAYAGENGR